MWIKMELLHTLASSMDTEHVLSFITKCSAHCLIRHTTAPALLLATPPKTLPARLPLNSSPPSLSPPVSKSFPSLFYSVYLTIKSPLSLAPKTAFTIILLLCSFVKKNSHCQPFFFSLLLTSGSPSPTDCSPHPRAPPHLHNSVFVTSGFLARAPTAHVASDAPQTVRQTHILPTAL